MRFRHTPIALALLALSSTMPFAVEAAPTVSFKKPDAGATLSNISISQSSACEVTGSNIKRVVFSITSSTGTTTALNTELTAPWNCNINSKNFTDGSYTLRAIAYDSANVSATATRGISIKNSTTGTTNVTPVVTFSKPANNATMAPGPVACQVTATDSDGIKQVQWFLDGKLINTELSAPYDTCNVNTTGLSGAHVIKAVATDNKGGIAEAQITVNVGSTTTTPPPVVTNPAPVVTFTKPANGATVSSGSVACAVTATDTDGIKQVQWFRDGTLVNTELSAPYDTCNINNLSAGTHVIKAVATDNKGAVGESQITVNVGSTTTNPAPVVTFSKPANGATLPTSGAVACQVTASDADGIKQVQWFLDGNLVNTEFQSPYDTCNINNLSAGAHVIKAVATDNKGGIGEAQITVNVGTSGGTTNTPPTVSLSAPAAGASLSGTAVPYQATASDTGGSVAKVELYLAASTLTASTSTASASTPVPVATHTAAPYEGTFDSTKHANGAYTLMAVATDNLGASSTTQRSVTISNTVSNPNPDPNPGPGTGTTLPSTNAKAIATFESLGLYWKPPSSPGAAGCTVRYRKATESAWQEALAMWYDARNSECRGSIVHLASGTDYVVEMGLPGQSPIAGLNTKTWSDNFPIAKTVQVQSGSQTLQITEGGTPEGYVLYTGPATIDVANAQDTNVTISAPYVIVRGLTLKGAKVDGIRLVEGAHDVVIEDNDISEWGRYRYTNSEGWKISIHKDSGISAYCRSGPYLERLIVQRNKIHHPRYGSNSWADGHPEGANAIFWHECGGNHVVRYNEIYSEWGRYFMDAIGGEENFSDKGMPNADTDIYGNRISHTWDDGIEAEGANRNVRIWGNYIDNTTVGIATTATHVGPVYVFRNVYNRSRQNSKLALDSDERNNFAKSGTSSSYGNGRRYVFHNTLLQATQAGVTYPLGAGGGIIASGTSQPLTNTVSRNNILHIWKSHWDSIRTQGGSGNDLDYDLRNGGISAYAGAEPNGIVGTPVYAPGHGWPSESNGLYQLAPTSPGYDRGTRLPNFNDGFTGSAPDIGAHEAGTVAMKFGVGASGSSIPGTTAGTTTSGSTSSTGSTTTAGSTSSDGSVCSSALCVITQ